MGDNSDVTTINWQELMTKDVITLENITSSRFRIFRSRLLIVVLAMLILLSSAVYGFANVDKSSSKAMAANKPEITRLAGNNPTPNPAPTAGPACVSRVIVLLDRSYSIINSAQSKGLPDRTYVVQLKNALLNMMTAVGTRAATYPGGRAEVMIDAFGTTSQWQNGMAPGQNFFDWVSGLNVADPTNRFFQSLNVGVSSDGTDGIWYSDTDSYPYNPFFPSTANKGYAGSVVLNPSDSYGTTNYHQAFVDAANMIDFWTNPSSTGDDDFDLVLMITDGVPTSNSGSNHSVEAGEPGIQGPWLNPDAADLLYAAYGVNKLRTGESLTSGTKVRPGVPVEGILVGSEAGNPSAWDHMNTVFGSGNWYGASNFTTDLEARITSATAGLNCTASRPVKTNVNPGIEITPVVSSPDDDPLTLKYEITEGNTATVTYTVKNTGDTDLKDVVVTAPGYSKSFGTIAKGAPPVTGSYTVSVGLGGELPPPQRVRVDSKVIYDPVTQNAPADMTPSDFKDLEFLVGRVPMPT